MKTVYDARLIFTISHDVRKIADILQMTLAQLMTCYKTGDMPLLKFIMTQFIDAFATPCFHVFAA